MAGQAELDAVRRAVALSQAALGATSPNPPVGAVVLDAQGAVVGEGWTSPPPVLAALGAHPATTRLSGTASTASSRTTLGDDTVTPSLEPARRCSRRRPTA